MKLSRTGISYSFTDCESSVVPTGGFEAGYPNNVAVFGAQSSGMAVVGGAQLATST